VFELGSSSSFNRIIISDLCETSSKSLDGRRGECSNGQAKLTIKKEVPWRAHLVRLLLRRTACAQVTELATGQVKDERIYLDGFEIYRRHSGVNAGLVRETLHIMDDKQRIALVETRNGIDDGAAKQLIRYQIGTFKERTWVWASSRIGAVSVRLYFRAVGYSRSRRFSSSRQIPRR
jgi:hypothetical protein